MKISTTQTRLRRQAAFTLVEVILAIIIALGILVTLLYFYQQATNLRTQILQETERLAATRLLMNRITGELRAAQPDPGFGPGFVGASNSIQFIRADVPSFSAWMGGPLGRSASPVSDLKVVRYRLESVDGTNVAGLLRTEEPLVPQQQLDLDEDVDLEEMIVFSQAPSAPVLEEIRFLQFRYWSGTNWADSWTGSGFPLGVEVSLGSEAQSQTETNETELAEWPAEVFRRVIYLAGNPGGRTSPEALPLNEEANSTPPEEAP